MLFVPFSSTMCRPNSIGSLINFKSSVTCHVPLSVFHIQVVWRIRRPRASYSHSTRRQEPVGVSDRLSTFTNLFSASQV